VKTVLAVTLSQEWQRKSESWDAERCSQQQQLESLQTQNRFLADKCDMIAETSSNLRSQLERRREKLDGTEHCLKAQVSQLSTLLEHSKDTISSQVRTLLLCAAAVELLMSAAVTAALISTLLRLSHTVECSRIIHTASDILAVCGLNSTVIIA